MSKRKEDALAARRLLDRVAFQKDHGPLLGLLATSYEFAAEFFETDFLPTVLGLGAWDDRAWTSRIALERALAGLQSATVLLDARCYRARPRSLRVETIPVSRPGQGILHAKVLLLVHERAVRLLVGSANLTEPGYRRNREVCAAFEASARQPAQAGLIRQAIAQLPAYLDEWWTPSARGLADAALGLLDSWAPVAPDETWFAWSGGAEPLWRQFLKHWPADEQIDRVTIVSPFWSEERGASGPLTFFLRELKSHGLLAPGASLRLRTEARPDGMDSWQPVLPPSLVAFDPAAFGVTATVQAVNPQPLPEEVAGRTDFTGTRDLHAKVVLCEGPRTSLAYAGSANFTRYGWGLMAGASANLEAGLILRRTGVSRAALVSLLPAATGRAVPLAQAAAGSTEPPEETPAEAAWPSFLREALLVRSTADPERLDLLLRVCPESIGGAWRALLEHSEPVPAETLYAHDPAGAVPCPAELRIALSSEMLGHLLQRQELAIEWWAAQQPQAVPINVDLAARLDLPIGPGQGRLSEERLLAYYQGRILFEDLFPEPGAPAEAELTSAEVLEAGGVDTSRIQSYMVREFVEALRGIMDDIRRAALEGTGATMRLALLGPVSPVALARAVVDAVRASQRTRIAGAFQLVEILSCLLGARACQVGESYQEEWHRHLGMATVELQGQLARLQEDWPADFADAGPFQNYAGHILAYHEQTGVIHD